MLKMVDDTTKMDNWKRMIILRFLEKNKGREYTFNQILKHTGVDISRRGFAQARAKLKKQFGEQKIFVKQYEFTYYYHA